MPTITRTTTTVTRTNVPTVKPSAARGWLKTLGFLMIVLGILGLVPYVVNVLHDYGVHFEAGMAMFHWAVGLVALVCAYALRNAMHVAIAAMAVGAIFLLVGALTFLYTDQAVFWHAGPFDNVLHLVIGTVTLLVGIKSLNRERTLGRSRVNVARTV